MPRRAALPLLLLALLLPVIAAAHGKATPTQPTDAVETGALPAVAIVDAFSAALQSLDVAKAGALLAEDALVLESGSAERSRAEYMASHAGEDALFLQQATVRRLRRVARSAGDLAWVATENEISTKRDDKPLVIRSTETMVLRRSRAGWRIVHIHWSSARVPTK